MRPSRLVVLLAGCLVLPAFLITLFSMFTRSSRHQTSSSTRTTTNQASGLKALFSFHSPSSLFPPSALISLTDDNSTFFLARPAAFGPLLPSQGFSGQLWVGSGFGDELARGGGSAAMGAEGELGCSDLPDWSNKNGDRASENVAKPAGGLAANAQSGTTNDGEVGTKQSGQEDGGTAGANAGQNSPKMTESISSEDDGTDDHLQNLHPAKDGSKSKRSVDDVPQDAQPSRNQALQHADIQSIQESAEISGKIVLLSRGGCGFLEKAKWVQRRGGTALIVGDDTRGGVLFTMYASGDTSNITIPSLFTSHTTAQLLSSLTSSNRYEEKSGGSEQSRSKPGDNSKASGNDNGGKDGDARGPNFTPTASVAKSTSTPTTAAGAKDDSFLIPESPFQVKESDSWLHSLLANVGIHAAPSTPSDLDGDSTRPPSSGELDWVLVDDWSEDDLPESPNGRDPTLHQGKYWPSKTRSITQTHRPTSTSTQAGKGDDFVIGVQDWRDPDLVGAVPVKSAAPGAASPLQKGNNAKADSKGNKASKPPAVGGNDHAREGGHRPDQDKATFKGGSITPGSGEYGQSDKGYTKDGKPAAADFSTSSIKKNGRPGDKAGSGNGWFSWHDDEDRAEEQAKASPNERPARSSSSPSSAGNPGEPAAANKDAPLEANEHEGLWVTLTPTSMSSSPFFDTLLVLVVSPLVTLSVVYALLLLRSRIRRRRWRAPKAVVERLPVRTYHTISTPATPMSTRYATTQATSPVSPLLQSPTSPRPRPRSQTTSAVQSEADVARSRPILIHDSPLAAEVEKPNMASSEWRRRYTGKQIECVVCLEEYVDGISKVMSLPCGHEFHVDCITPWLTTRRRTCPICKGDVVRSLADASPASAFPTPYRDDPNENEDVTILSDHHDARVRSQSTTGPSGADRIPDENADLERGEDENEDQPGSSWTAPSLASFQNGVRRLTSVIGNEQREHG